MLGLKLSTCPYRSNVLALDGFINATLGNVERLACQPGYRFENDASDLQIECVNVSTELRWDPVDIPECIRKFTRQPSRNCPWSLARPVTKV